MRAIAANEGRYPISAQCRLLSVARSTYYSMRSRADRPAAPDPAAPAVVAAHAASKGRYGSRKIKASFGRSGVTVSRRRVCRIMRENGLASAYGRKRFKVHPGAVNEADAPNVVARGFGGRAPRTHICSDLTYVRVGASWNYVCLLVDPCNREIVGHLLASIYFSPVSLNRRTVRAKAVSPVALTYFHRFRSRLDGPVPR
ncbi:IS3 family transposase, partial [Collinsella sp. WCA1-178-WT-3 (M2)]|uniref:IS3 family transposase n=1 Tax=unclassified Collinsella TaxID=2637548 RepID=UPI003519FA54